jgi:hypothetical protein
MMKRNGVTIEQLQAAGEWGKQQVNVSWHPLPITEDYFNRKTLFVVKTATGRVLSGTIKAFRDSNMQKIMDQPKYGRPVSWLQVPR